MKSHIYLNFMHTVRMMSCSPSVLAGSAGTVFSSVLLVLEAAGGLGVVGLLTVFVLPVVVVLVDVVAGDDVLLPAFKMAAASPVPIGSEKEMSAFELLFPLVY